MALMQYGAEWRACRKLEHVALGPVAVKQYLPMQARFAALLAKEIAEDPENFYDLVRLCVAPYHLRATLTDFVAEPQPVSCSPLPTGYPRT